MELKQRFKGAIGREYALFEEAYPHFNELQERIAREVKESVGNSKDTTILEIGCGPGPTTKKLLDQNSSSKIVGVDNESVMIEQAKEYLSNYKNRLELVTSDALSYLNGVPDATFDAVASGWTIHNFEETYREQVLKEIYRVLKPNGVFVNGDKYAQDDKDKHLADFNWSIEQFIENMSKKGHQDICYEWILHMSYDESKGILMKEGESLSLLNEVGFVNPKIIWRKHMEAVLITRK